MADFPTMPLYTDALIADTPHLTNEEFGIYMRLLCFAWRTKECRLPSDHKRLAIMVGMTPARFKKTAAPLLDEFFTESGGFFVQKKLKTVRENVERMREQKSYAGKQSARAKALKDNGRDSTGVDAQQEQSQEQDDNTGDTGEGTSAQLTKTKTKTIDATSVASAAERGAEPPSHRENILEAMGLDASGVYGPNGKILGTTADMAIARRWSETLGLTEAEQVSVIRDVVQRLGKAPGSFTYFDGPMNDLAEAKKAVTTGIPPEQPRRMSNGPARREQQQNDFHEFARRLSEGEDIRGADPSDPFSRR